MCEVGSIIRQSNVFTAFQFCLFVCFYITIKFSLQRDVWKDPTTDAGKQSKRGRLTLERREDGKLVTVEKGQGDVTKVSCQSVLILVSLFFHDHSFLLILMILFEPHVILFGKVGEVVNLESLIFFTGL